MPELPEVETIRVQISKAVMGKVVTNVQILSPKIRYVIPRTLARIAGSFAISCERKGKFIIINFSNDNSVIIHLGMSGKILFGDGINGKTADELKHQHYNIDFEGGISLSYYDPRRFGFVDIIETKKILEHKSLSRLGLEPFDSSLNLHTFMQKLQKSGATIKSFLLDQSKVAGIGNIYACEILFLARVSPFRVSNSVNQKEAESILYFAREVLTNAIKKKGSTLKDYRTADNEKGGFQDYFSVYGRDGLNCSICEKLILKAKQLGRYSFYCSDCQQ